MTFLAALDGVVSDLLDRIADTIAVKASKTEAHSEATKERLTEHLETPRTRAMVAKMARSSCDDYLQTIAESAQLPFGSAGQFLSLIKGLMDGHASINLNRAPDATFNPADDAPFGVINKVNLTDAQPPSRYDEHLAEQYAHPYARHDFPAHNED